MLDDDVQLKRIQVLCPFLAAKSGQRIMLRICQHVTRLTGGDFSNSWEFQECLSTILEIPKKGS